MQDKWERNTTYRNPKDTKLRKAIGCTSVFLLAGTLLTTGYFLTPYLEGRKPKSIENKVEATSQPVKPAVKYEILPQNSKLTYDSVTRKVNGKTETVFSLYKYDFPDNMGSYSLYAEGGEQDPNFSDRLKLRYYVGNGVWGLIDDDTRTDPWKAKLKIELKSKIDSGEFLIETVFYPSENK